ncbi:DUF4855 domain-containing protein [Thermococcus prieurii]
MTLRGRVPTSYDEVAHWFKSRGFDRVVFLSGEGRGINYTGNGYEDGRYLALWIMSHISSIKYYVTIPFSQYGSKKLRDDPSEGFANSYWRDWIDGVLSVFDSNRLGFYWSYESCLQATPHDEANVTEEFIREMSRYIHNHNQEFIWIPATGSGSSVRGVSYLNDPDYDGILTIGGYFDYVFVQPNYYEYSKVDEEGNPHLPYTYEKLVEMVRWVYEELPKKIREHNPNAKTTVSIEMEADRAVLLGQCGHCADCEYKNNKCVQCNNEKCRERACQYVWAILEVYSEVFNRRPPIPPDRAIDTLFPDRAYYFGTDFTVIDKVRETCPEW